MQEDIFLTYETVDFKDVQSPTVRNVFDFWQFQWENVLINQRGFAELFQPVVLSKRWKSLYLFEFTLLDDEDEVW